MPEHRHHDREAEESGSDPIASAKATIRPQTAIVVGFLSTALTEVSTAAITPTLRSSSSGNETTVSVSTTTANRKPTKLPMTMSRQPAGVVKIWRMNVCSDSGGA